MKITLNGEIKEVSSDSTLLSLLEENNTDPKTVIIELDGEIIKPDDFASSALKEDSVVEVLRFVGGG